MALENVLRHRVQKLPLDGDRALAFEVYGRYSAKVLVGHGDTWSNVLSVANQ